MIKGSASLILVCIAFAGMAQTEVNQTTQRNRVPLPKKVNAHPIKYKAPKHKKDDPVQQSATDQKAVKRKNNGTINQTDK